MSETIDYRLPCPFCGSDNISDGENLIEAEAHGVGRVTCKQSECLNCGACGPLSQPVNGPDYGDVAAIAAWNRRRTTLRDELAELEAATNLDVRGYKQELRALIRKHYPNAEPCSATSAVPTEQAPQEQGS